MSAARATTACRQTATARRRPAAIAVEHIVKRYGDFEAVKDVNFSVSRGRDLRAAGAERRRQRAR
jgi:ABC-type uncharacterized transport system ATPase subunit